MYILFSKLNWIRSWYSLILFMPKNCSTPWLALSRLQCTVYQNRCLLLEVIFFHSFVYWILLQIIWWFHCSYLCFVLRYLANSCGWQTYLFGNIRKICQLPHYWQNLLGRQLRRCSFIQVESQFDSEQNLFGRCPAFNGLLKLSLHLIRKFLWKIAISDNVIRLVITEAPHNTKRDFLVILF